MENKVGQIFEASRLVELEKKAVIEDGGFGRQD